MEKTLTVESGDGYYIQVDVLEDNTVLATIGKTGKKSRDDQSILFTAAEAQETFRLIVGVLPDVTGGE